MFRRLSLLLASAALVLAACGGGGEQTADLSSTPAPGDSAASNADLLDFQATTAQGDALDMSQYAGADLVVWFWAPW